MSKSIFDVMIDGGTPEAEVELIETAPAKLDLDAARRILVQTFSEQVETACALAENFTVESEWQLTQGIDLASDLNKLSKALDAKTRGITKEAREFTSGMNGLKNHFLEKIDPAVRSLKTKLHNYQRKVAIEEAERERKAREEQEHINKQLEEEAAAKGVTADLPPLPPAPDKAKTTTTRTASGASLGVRKEWKCTGVVDIKAVPAEYLQVDMVKVNAAIKAGVHEIAGLKIEEVETSVLR